MLASLECHEFLYLYLCCSQLLQLQTSRKINHAGARKMVTKLSRHPSSSQAWDYLKWWQQQIQATVRELPTKSTKNYTNHQTTCNQILSPFYFFCGIMNTKAPAGGQSIGLKHFVNFEEFRDCKTTWEENANKQACWKVQFALPKWTGSMMEKMQIDF